MLSVWPFLSSHLLKLQTSEASVHGLCLSQKRQRGFLCFVAASEYLPVKMIFWAFWSSLLKCTGEMTCPGGCIFLGLDHPVRQAGEGSLLWELLEAFQHCASHGVFQRNHISTCPLRTDIADLMGRAVTKLHCQQFFFSLPHLGLSWFIDYLHIWVFRQFGHLPTPDFFWGGGHTLEEALFSCPFRTAGHMVTFVKRVGQVVMQLIYQQYWE